MQSTLACGFYLYFHFIHSYHFGLVDEIPSITSTSDCIEQSSFRADKKYYVEHTGISLNLSSNSTQQRVSVLEPGKGGYIHTLQHHRIDDTSCKQPSCQRQWVLDGVHHSVIVQSKGFVFYSFLML